MSSAEKLRALASIIQHMDSALAQARISRSIGRNLGAIVRIDRTMGRIRVETDKTVEFFDNGLAENLAQAYPGDNISVFGEEVGCDTVLVGTFDEQLSQATRAVHSLKMMHDRMIFGR